ncbi:hypothetical protein [Litchfieldia salsa]|uniref:Uncharacterized protein n=1 Tax=Litchfieldia salsa TaxID=930152 RepID=A0A1H0SR97_9BACI|nr:hypothetical protein [Litchfieldia salsa]SDP44271.1 hypothetical protein SAMN05216565_10378 [Litchfieldia salsa]
MESRLRKSSIYGFLIGLAVSILFVDYKEVTQVGNGVTQTTYKPVIEYIVLILRFGIIGMFLGLFIGWKGYERKHKTQQEKTYYLPFFFIVFIVSILLMAVSNW